jgi:hypothetical protein
MSNLDNSRLEFPASEIISSIESGGPVILSNVAVAGD